MRLASISGDVISEEEIAKTADDFMINSRRIGLSHRRRLSAEVLQSYTAPANFQFENQTVKKGSWILKIRILDEGIWQAVEAGLLQSFSVSGYATREAEA